MLSSFDVKVAVDSLTQKKPNLIEKFVEALRIEDGFKFHIDISGFEKLILLFVVEEHIFEQTHRFPVMKIIFDKLGSVFAKDSLRRFDDIEIGSADEVNDLDHFRQLYFFSFVFLVHHDAQPSPAGISDCDFLGILKELGFLVYEIVGIELQPEGD